MGELGNLSKTQLPPVGNLNKNCNMVPAILTITIMMKNKGSLV